jgi:hypothetical protein
LVQSSRAPVARLDHEGGGVLCRDLEDALARHDKPDHLQHPQGSQFTGTAFATALNKNAIAISMDGRVAWRDNVFVERLWRSVIYEGVCEPTTASALPVLLSIVISTFTTAADHRTP